MPLRLGIQPTPLVEIKSPKGGDDDSGGDAQEENEKELLLAEEVRKQAKHEEDLPFVVTGGAGLFGRVDFFAVGFDFPQGVDRLILRFVISACHDFAEQAH